MILHKIRQDFGPFPVQTGSELKFKLAIFINVAYSVFSPNLSILGLTIQIWTILREIRREICPIPVQTGSEPKFDLATFKNVTWGVFSPKMSFLALTVTDLGLLGGGKAILEHCALYPMCTAALEKFQSCSLRTSHVIFNNPI